MGDEDTIQKGDGALRGSSSSQVACMIRIGECAWSKRNIDGPGVVVVEGDAKGFTTVNGTTRVHNRAVSMGGQEAENAVKSGEGSGVGGVGVAGEAVDGVANV